MLLLFCIYRPMVAPEKRRRRQGWSPFFHDLDISNRRNRKRKHAERDRQSSSKAIKSALCDQTGQNKVLFISFRTERNGTERKRIDQGNITRTSRSIDHSRSIGRRQTCRMIETSKKPTSNKNKTYNMESVWFFFIIWSDLNLDWVIKLY